MDRGGGVVSGRECDRSPGSALADLVVRVNTRSQRLQILAITRIKEMEIDRVIPCEARARDASLVMYGVPIN